MKKNGGRKERRHLAHVNRRADGRTKIKLNAKGLWPVK